MKRAKSATNQELIAIGGPTASGKSKLALALAQRLGTEIISADSRQIYRGLDVGTAKPTAKELMEVPHHFIDHLNIGEPYSAAKYEREASARIEAVLAAHQTAILVGGTGLYLKAVLEGLDDIPTVAQVFVEEWQNQLDAKGLPYVQDQLQQTDPVYFAMADIQNPRRIIRALSVCSATGRPYSSFLRQKPKQLPFRVVAICLAPPREELYRRINDRVDLMLQSGLVEEARSFLPWQKFPSLQTVGYQEFFPYFEGVYDLSEAIRLVKRNTRRYAKRQMTWFRNQGTWQLVLQEDVDEQLKCVEEKLQMSI